MWKGGYFKGDDDIEAVRAQMGQAQEIGVKRRAFLHFRLPPRRFRRAERRGARERDGESARAGVRAGRRPPYPRRAGQSTRPTQNSADHTSTGCSSSRGPWYHHPKVTPSMATLSIACLILAG